MAKRQLRKDRPKKQRHNEDKILNRPEIHYQPKTQSQAELYYDLSGGFRPCWYW